MTHFAGSLLEALRESRPLTCMLSRRTNEAKNAAGSPIRKGLRDGHLPLPPPAPTRPWSLTLFHRPSQLCRA